MSYSIRNLLAADSATTQNTLLDSGREKWLPAFVEYYDLHLASAITSSAQFAMQQVDCALNDRLSISNLES